MIKNNRKISVFLTSRIVYTSPLLLTSNVEKDFRAQSQKVGAGQNIQDHPDQCHLVDKKTKMAIVIGETEA